MPKKKRKIRKRKRTKIKKRKKSKIIEGWFLFALVILILFVLIFFSPSEKIMKTAPEEIQDLPGIQQTPTEIEIEYSCKKNFDCLLVNCKSTPSIVECVNVTKSETYYKQCKAHWDVNVAQDFTKCVCDQEICKALK